MWFQNSNLADYPLLRYAGQLFGDGLISSLSSQEAGAVLADLDRLWQQHSREIAGIGMSWWKRALLPHGPRTAPSAHQIHENRLRVLEWANNSYAPAELFLYRVETIATDPAHFNLVAALKIPAAVIRSSLDRWEYERHLMRLTRVECRDVLGKIQWQMSTRGWSYEQFFNHHLRAVYGFDCASFMTRVRNQAGEYEERFEPIFENLSAQQAAQVLRHADRDGLELPVSRRESLKKAASRSRELERHYDNMDPQVAWAELCSKTGVVEATAFSPHPFNASTKEMASMLLYEAQTLLPDEHVSGLIRASHLLVNGGTIPGLALRLELPVPCNEREIAAAVSKLTPYEAFAIQTELVKKNPTDGELAAELGFFDEEDAEQANGVIRCLREQLAQRVRECGGLTLKQLAAGAVTRKRAWQALVDHVEGPPGMNDSWTLVDRERLAVALLCKFPNGLPDEVEIMAVKALLGMHLRDPQVRSTAGIQSLNLRGRLRCAGERPNPLSAMLLLSRDESRSLLYDLEVIAKSSKKHTEIVTQAALLTAQLTTPADSTSVAHNFLLRLSLQAGCPFAVSIFTPKFMTDSRVISEISTEQAKQILAEERPWHKTHHASRRWYDLVRYSMVGRSPEDDAKYDTMSPAKAWYQLCKRVNRVDLIGAFLNLEKRPAAATELARALAPFDGDPEVAGLRRAACFAADILTTNERNVQHSVHEPAQAVHRHPQRDTDRAPELDRAL